MSPSAALYYDDSTSLILAVLLLGIFSAVLRPILVLFTLPFVILTMGVGLLIINALLYAFVGYLVNGFYVDGFGYAISRILHHHHAQSILQ